MPTRQPSCAEPTFGIAFPIQNFGFPISDLARGQLYAPRESSSLLSPPARDVREARYLINFSRKKERGLQVVCHDRLHALRQTRQGANQKNQIPPARGYRQFF